MSLVAHKGNLAEEATAKKARKVWDDDGALYFPDPSDDGESDDDDLSSVEDFVPDGEEIADALSMNRKIWVDFAKGKGAVRTTVSMAPPGGLNKAQDDARQLECTWRNCQNYCRSSPVPRSQLYSVQPVCVKCH
jgi:hypothetical protein